MEKTLSQQVADIANLSEFATKSGIPLRTLTRIKNKPGHEPAKATGIVLQAALKRLKPKTKDAT